MSRKSVLLLIILCAVALAVASCGPLRKPLFGPRLETMAFYEKGWSDLTFGYPSLTRHYRDLSTVMPFWYSIDPSGRVVPARHSQEPRAVSFLRRQRRLRLLPLVTNLEGNDAMLTDQRVGDRSIENIISLVRQEGYDGVVIDFQLIPPRDRDALTSFVGRLSTRLKGEHKLLGVTAFPKVGVPADVSGAYDYPALANRVDYLFLMTYDHSSETTEPGPVAPVGWVEDNVKYALNQGVPPKKLVITLAAYGYDWAAPGQGESLGLREIMARANTAGAEVLWDDASQSPHFTYWDGGQQHSVWFENGFSAAQRVALARDYGLRGVAIWRLGFEDETYWQRLRAALAGRS